MTLYDAAAQTPWEREGLAHTVFTFREALRNFQAARAAGVPNVAEEQRKCGTANLAHAWFVAVTDAGLLPVDEARELFNELCTVAGTWA